MDDRYIYFALIKDLYERWRRQIDTNYADLSEQEKESDCKEARSYVPLLLEALEAQKSHIKETLLAGMAGDMENVHAECYHREEDCIFDQNTARNEDRALINNI